MKKILSVQDMALIALFVALMAVCSWINLNIGLVPFTLQTFAVFTIGGLLGAKRGTIAIIVYILLGMVGLPVFAAFSSGVAAIVGPAGGYIIGFIPTVIIIGLVTSLTKKKRTSIRMIFLVISMILGDASCFIIGTIQYMIVAKTGVVAALSMCVVPFIVPDLVKIVVAAIIVDRVRKYAGKIFD